MTRGLLNKIMIGYCLSVGVGICMLSDISLVRRPSYGLRDPSLQGKVGVCVMNTVTYINIHKIGDDGQILHEVRINGLHL